MISRVKYYKNSYAGHQFYLNLSAFLGIYGINDFIQHEWNCNLHGINDISPANDELSIVGPPLEPYRRKDQQQEVHKKRTMNSKPTSAGKAHQAHFNLFKLTRKPMGVKWHGYGRPVRPPSIMALPEIEDITKITQRFSFRDVPHEQRTINRLTMVVDAHLMMYDPLNLTRVAPRTE